MSAPLARKPRPPRYQPIIVREYGTPESAVAAGLRLLALPVRPDCSECGRRVERFILDRPRPADAPVRCYACLTESQGDYDLPEEADGV